MMINASGTTPISTPTAATLTRGVTGRNLEQVAHGLAEESFTVTEVLDRPTRSEMASDLASLKVQLWARVSESHMGNAMMVAGALMGGPHGVVLSNLQGTLKTTLASPQKLDKLASDIEAFHQECPGDPLLSDARAESLGTAMKRSLVAMGSKEVPTALFIGGALANAHQDQGTIVGH